MNHDDSSSNGRRKFLGAGLMAGSAALSPNSLGRLVQLMTQGLIEKAQAAETGVQATRNYVNLLLPGAPNRYVFDHWLRTNDSDPQIVPNDMNTTALTGSAGRVTGTQYQTFNYNGLLVPQFFSHNVVNGAGSSRPLTDLLRNMCVIRGYGTGFDGHSPNVTAQLGPLGGASSITGVAADYSNKSFQALQYPARTVWGNYTSSTGRALNVVNSAMPLGQLMAGFKPAPGSVGTLMARRQAALTAATSALQMFAKSEYAGSSTVAANMSGAKELMKKGINDVDSFWTEAMARYTRVFNGSARAMNLPGFSDMSLAANTGDAKWQINPSEGVVMPRGDLGSVISRFNAPPNLIEGFALAEYVLTRGLVTSLELMIPSDFGNGIILTDGTVAEPNKTNFTYHTDMHETGAIGTIVTTAPLFRGIAAILLELIDVLKSKQANGSDLWSQTVFQITSDFGRVGRSSGFGADHGINQMVTSVYSGVIQKPMVIGNIWDHGNNPGLDEGAYKGTQGAAAPIPGYNQPNSPSPAMMASTVAGLLGVPSNPFANVAEPLINVVNGVAQITKAAAAGKMVAK